MNTQDEINEQERMKMKVNQPNSLPTAEEYFIKNFPNTADKISDDSSAFDYTVECMNDFANLKCKPLEDEVEGLKQSRKTQEVNADYWKKQYEESIIRIGDLESELRLAKKGLGG